MLIAYFTSILLFPLQSSYRPEEVPVSQGVRARSGSRPVHSSIMATHPSQPNSLREVNKARRGQGHAGQLGRAGQQDRTDNMNTSARPERPVQPVQSTGVANGVVGSRARDAEPLSSHEVTLWRSTEYLMRITEEDVKKRFCRRIDLRSERPLWALIERRSPASAQKSSS